MARGQVVRRAVALGGALAATAGVSARRRPLAAASVAAVGGLAGLAAFHRNAPLFGPLLRHGPRTRARAALTFDDGPGPSTPRVLEALAAAEVRATFFVLGRQVERHPALVRRIAAEGHQLGSHGYDHGILVFRGHRHVVEQLARTEVAVAEALGAPALSPLFRAPHGFRGPTTWAAARSRGYRMVGWTRGVFDSAEPGLEVIADRAARALAPGAILLLHDADGWRPEATREQTAAALPKICRSAERSGLTLVTLDALVEGGAS